MRLTNTLRSAFVRAAMDDVPKVDYVEQLRNYANQENAKLLKAAGLAGSDLNRLNSHSFYVYLGKHYHLFLLRGASVEETKTIQNSPEVKKIAQSYKEQEEKLDALEEKLTSVVAGCTTRKQLEELMPEFAKYLPAEAAKTANLPAVSNVMGDFIRAGWPKHLAKKAA